MQELNICPEFQVYLHMTYLLSIMKIFSTYEYNTYLLHICSMIYRRFTVWTHLQLTKLTLVSGTLQLLLGSGRQMTLPMESGNRGVEGYANRAQICYNYAFSCATLKAEWDLTKGTCDTLIERRSAITMPSLGRLWKQSEILSREPVIHIMLGMESLVSITSRMYTLYIPLYIRVIRGSHSSSLIRS